MGSQQFRLRWNNHQHNMLDVFSSLLESESLVDVTLACDGISLKAHKVVLSACSPFFEEVFLNNPCKHPIVILKDIGLDDMKAILKFMYQGEVNVSQDQMMSLLKSADTLKVKGLAEMSAEGSQLGHNSVPAKKKKQSKPKMQQSVKSNQSTPHLASLLNKGHFQSLSDSYQGSSNVNTDEEAEIGPQDDIRKSSKFSDMSDKQLEDGNRSMDDEMNNMHDQDSPSDAKRELNSHSLDLLTVDDSQMVMVKEEKVVPDLISYEEEYMNLSANDVENSCRDNYSESKGSAYQPYSPTQSPASSYSYMLNNTSSLVVPSSSRKRRMWTDVEMQTAVNAVLHGGWTTYSAASHFGIPRRTLRYYIEKVRLSESPASKSSSVEQVNKSAMVKSALKPATSDPPVETPTLEMPTVETPTVETIKSEPVVNDNY